MTLWLLSSFAKFRDFSSAGHCHLRFAGRWYGRVRGMVKGLSWKLKTSESESYTWKYKKLETHNIPFQFFWQLWRWLLYLLYLARWDKYQFFGRYHWNQIPRLGPRRSFFVGEEIQSNDSEWCAGTKKTGLHTVKVLRVGEVWWNVPPESLNDDCIGDYFHWWWRLVVRKRLVKVTARDEGIFSSQPSHIPDLMPLKPCQVVNNLLQKSKRSNCSKYRIPFQIAGWFFFAQSVWLRHAFL